MPCFFFVIGKEKNSLTRGFGENALYIKLDSLSCAETGERKGTVLSRLTLGLACVADAI